MRRTPKKMCKATEIIKRYILENLKEYILVSIIMLIGVIIGVVFLNNMSEAQIRDIQTYLTNFTGELKDGKTINSGELLKKSLGSNLLLVFIMWFVGSTVIGIPIVLEIVLFRGFCLGYTISAAVNVWGTGRGVIFFLTSMMLQNLIIIPCVIGMAVSGIKMYKSIVKDKRRKNIKVEIIRHTIFSLIILAVLTVASFIETYLSINLLVLCKEYF